MSLTRVSSLAAFAAITVLLPSVGAEERQANVDPQLSEAIATVVQVQPGASNHGDVSAAVRKIETFGQDALVPLLNAIGDGTLAADNWIRGAFEAIAAEGTADVTSELMNFYDDRSNNPRGRRLAFETVTADDAELRRDLLRDALDDPSEEMRYAAVGQLLTSVDGAESDEEKRKIYEAALKAATVRSQVDEIARGLSNLGQEVDKQTHFGFLTEWSAVGPFDNKDMKGFDVAYGPERGDLASPDLEATFDGSLGDAAWTGVSTSADDGVVDLAEQLGPHKGALVYVTTSVDAVEQQSVVLRLSTANAWKLWLNGRPLFEREEYHRGLHWDQYRIPATLQKGTNVIVVKVLQNEQDQSWAQRWSYSLRVTKPSGQALLSVAAAN